MGRFQLHFSIPEARQGDRRVYESYITTLDRLDALKGVSRPKGRRVEKGTRVHEVHATSGSVTGAAMIEATSYESALRLICRETPILDMEWHLEEYVEPDQMAKIIREGLKQKS